MEQAKVRQAVLGVVHSGGQPAHGLVAPGQAHENFRVEVHALAQLHAVDQRQGGRQRVDPKTAHRIRYLQRQAVDPHPHMGEVARVKPALGDAGIVLWITAHQRLWMAPRQVEEAADVGQVMLAIGVHLQGVAEAQSCRFAQTGHHRAALALIDRQGHQMHIRGLCQLRQHLGAVRVAGVVDQHTGQAGAQQIGDDGRHRAFALNVQAQGQCQFVAWAHQLLELEHFHAAEAPVLLQQGRGQGDGPVDLDHARQYRGLREVSGQAGRDLHSFPTRRSSDLRRSTACRVERPGAGAVRRLRGAVPAPRAPGCAGPAARLGGRCAAACPGC